MTPPDECSDPIHGRVRPVRDRTTLLAYAQLGLLGWFVYGFGASLTLLRDDEGLTRTVAALLGAAPHPLWTHLFLATAVATSVTGFFFPNLYSLCYWY